MEDAITYQELKLSLCDILYVEHLHITEEVNCHATMELTVLLKGRMKSEVIHEMGETVTLFCFQGDEIKPLFQGRITDLRLLSEGGSYRLKAEAKSFTYDMDIQRKSAPYQDAGMLSHEVIRSIMTAYPGSDCQPFLENEAIGELIVQYEETDWEFLKRFASKYNKGIYVDNSFSGIRYYAGVPDLKKNPGWDLLPYAVYKDLEQFRRQKENGFPGMPDSDLVTWKVQACEYYPLGTTVCFQGRQAVIFRAERLLRGGILTSEYHMRKEEGLRQPRYYNDRIIGVSVDGNVEEVRRDRIRARLRIDAGKSGNTYWFPFSTVAASKGGNGWFCMPRAGDAIRAYFPDARESQGYLVTKAGEHMPPEPASSLPAASPAAAGGAGGAPPAVDPMGDPNVKNIVTPSGNEISFSESGVEIRAAGGTGQIMLGMDGSVTVSGMQSLSLCAAEEIHLRAEEEISLSGDLMIDASCEKDGHLAILPGGIMQLSAKEIHGN